MISHPYDDDQSANCEVLFLAALLLFLLGQTTACSIQFVFPLYCHGLPLFQLLEMYFSWKRKKNS